MVSVTESEEFLKNYLIRDIPWALIHIAYCPCIIDSYFDATTFKINQQSHFNTIKSEKIR